MRCTCCGRELTQNDRLCPDCGENNDGYVENVVTKQYNQQPQQTYINQEIKKIPIYPNSNLQPTQTTQNHKKAPVSGSNQTKSVQVQQKRNVSSLKQTAKVFMIIGAILEGICIFPLIWTIPMTRSYCRKIENGEPIDTGFKVCTLLFVSTIAGILMLADGEN